MRETGWSTRPLDDELAEALCAELLGWAYEHSPRLLHE